MGGGEPDGDLLPLPQGARAVRLLCTSVRSFLKEVEHPGTHSPGQTLKQNILENQSVSIILAVRQFCLKGKP